MTEAAQRADSDQDSDQLDGRNRSDRPTGIDAPRPTEGTVVPLKRHANPPGARPEPGPHAQPNRRDPLLRTLLGDVLRQARREQKRTLSDVAERAGVSVPYLSEIERGRKEPSSEMLAAVAGALGLDLLDLVSRSYIDLVGRRVAEADAVRPQRVGRTAGRHGDVLALAA
jgi:DNA-binding XRE family transcriptional regulator